MQSGRGKPFIFSPSYRKYFIHAPKYIQLTLEQHRFELCRPTHTWIFTYIQYLKCIIFSL